MTKAGGNAIRIWDTLHLAAILDSAWANDLAVIVGLPIPDNQNYMIYYDNPDKVAAQLKAYKTIVNAFKAHPAVLMWCVGNELTFPFGPAYTNFYKAFNEIVDMTHQDDPDHPVTTTILNFKLFQQYAKPELLYQQDAYLSWLRKLVIAIKQIDPARPVTVDVEVNETLPQTIEILHRVIPEIDSYGLLVEGQMTVDQRQSSK